MTRLVLVGTLLSALGGATAFAQATQPDPTAKPARRAARAGGNTQAGHTAPKAQPETAPAPSIPAGEMALGTVRIPKAVKAEGKTLAAGTYQVRLTAQPATPPAPGQTAAAERYAELLRGGKVMAREVVTIIPQSEIDKVQKDAPPRPNGVKVETLKGGDYLRVWINKGGNHYLLHLPA
ncbi:MAG TPA: hypothetical protein VGQ16_05480 [Vicinamibacterales bacterium]|jgi:hypothetical protein|nr:hypothetical protein [Vicinamibacterales bacterium]